MTINISEAGAMIITGSGQESRLASQPQVAWKWTIGRLGHISGTMFVSSGAIHNMTKTNDPSISGVAVIIIATADVGKRALESGTMELLGGGVLGTETSHLHLVPVGTMLTIASVIEKGTRLHLRTRRHQYLTRSCSQKAHLLNHT